jgi:hypothetical protein
MHVTITQLRKVWTDPNGRAAGVLAGFVAEETLTAAGESAALADGVAAVRIATDTAITVDAFGGTSACLMPASSVEVFPAAPGQTFTIADATPEA